MSTHLVSYSDTDAGGVLHHAKYIEIAERGYHWWLKKRNTSFRNLNLDHNLSLVVYDLSAKYKSAIFLEDEIRIIGKVCNGRPVSPEETTYAFRC
jgi:acyl-CoA thioester hydrolase